MISISHDSQARELLEAAAKSCGLTFLAVHFIPTMGVEGRYLEVGSATSGPRNDPKPSRLAVIFKQIAFIAGLSFLQDGNRRRVNGFISLERISVIPPESAIFISPVQAHIMPSIVKTNSTAPVAPLMTAAESCGTLPVATAQSILSRIMPAQI